MDFWRWQFLDNPSGKLLIMALAPDGRVAARIEEEATGTSQTLAATARFIAAPRRERFVSRNTHAARELIERGQPPAR